MANKTSKKQKSITKSSEKTSSNLPIKILNILAYALGISFIICYILIFAFQIAQNNSATLFGFSLFRVGSGSMEPTLNIGDEIIVQNSEDYNVGDIITYSVGGGNYVTHRIVSKDQDVIVTKGDANNVEDDPIHTSDIIGKFTTKAHLLNFVISYKIPIIAIFGVLILVIFFLKK